MRLGVVLGLLAAIVMIAVGGLWALQGMGYLGGSFTADNDTWTYIGAILAGFGVALIIVLVQNRVKR